MALIAVAVEVRASGVRVPCHDVQDLVVIAIGGVANGAVQKSRNVANLAAVNGNRGMPLSGRPLRITGPIVFPFSSSRTITDAKDQDLSRRLSRWNRGRIHKKR
jgi:hypothetical protein